MSKTPTNIELVADTLMIMRHDRNLTKTKLSEISGVSVNVIYRMENCLSKRLDLEALEKLATAFGSPIRIAVFPQT